MSSQLTKPLLDVRLKTAAEEAVKACGPVLAGLSRNMLDREKATELDRARDSLLALAKTLEVK